MIKKNLQYLLFSLLVIGSVSTSEAQLFKKKAKAKAPTEAKPKIDKEQVKKFAAKKLKQTANQTHIKK